MPHSNHQRHHHGGETVCPSCDIAPFTRNHYFTGKLMLERDFTDETRYHIDKLRHHHQRLHGWGVVCGLKVKQHEQEQCRDRFVCIEPGTAIDCCGHEIVVREEECIDITQFEAIKTLKKNEGEMREKPKHTIEIRICYRECPTEEIPVLYDECGCDDTKCAPNRILESYDFDVVVDPPKPPHPAQHEDCKDILWKHLEGCPHCDTPECIVLATIEGYHVRDKIWDMPAEPQDEANNIVRINNKTRPLLPSTQTLFEYIECLRDQGGGGGQGPKGDKGDKGDPGEKGDKGDPGPGLEEGLTQIVRLSWEHNKQTPLVPITDVAGVIHRGIVVGFSRPVSIPNETTESAADHVFQVLVQHDLLFEDEPQLGRRGVICRCPIEGTILPVKPDPATGLITSAQQTASPATGLAFVLRGGIGERIRQRDINGNPIELWVRLRGDFVLDEDKRAVDAEFVRAELPSGDRPSPLADPTASKFGIQGGLFESWFKVGRG